MDSLKFKNVYLFPKKTSILGLSLFIFLFFISIFIISTMWNTLQEVEDKHFPMVERSSINVRLIKLIDYQFKMALSSKNSQIVEDLIINFESLKQNYNSLALQDSALKGIAQEKVFTQAQEIIEHLKKRQWEKAQLEVNNMNFNQNLSEFSFKIFDKTELMAERRDQKSQQILNFIKQSGIIAVITIFFLMYLVSKIYKGYTLNLKERLFAEQKAQVLSKQRQALIHVLCHDLGNPVSAIYSLTQMGHLLSEDDKNKTMDTIKENAKESLNIIEITRKMQAIETGKIELEKEAVNLKEAIEASLKILNEKVSTKNIQLKISLHQDSAVLADKTILINSIFNNILSNSIKFSQQGQSIEISEEILKDKIIIQIKDFGQGIPKDILENLFSESAHTTRLGTDGEKGTGFGMPLVKKFVNALEGSIEVQSSITGDNQGTTSILTFKRHLG